MSYTYEALLDLRKDCTLKLTERQDLLRMLVVEILNQYRKHLSLEEEQNSRATIGNRDVDGFYQNQHVMQLKTNDKNALNFLMSVDLSGDDGVKFSSFIAMCMWIEHEVLYVEVGNCGDVIEVYDYKESPNFQTVCNEIEKHVLMDLASYMPN